MQTGRPEFFSFVTPSYRGLSPAAHPLAQLLRIGRARLDLPQVEVAQLAGVSRFRLHQAERGLIPLRADELERLGRVLELPELGTFAEAGSEG